MKVTLIVASNYQQALLVTRRFGLPRPNSGATLDGRKVVAAIPPDGRHRIMGLLPDRVIFCNPVLDGADVWDIRTEARLRAARAGVDIEMVHT